MLFTSGLSSREFVDYFSNPTFYTISLNQLEGRLSHPQSPQT